MKKLEVDGYIARDEYNIILFSNMPMHKSGFFGEDGIWYDTLETDEIYPLHLRVEWQKYLDIPELTFENSPRHCRLILEIGDQVTGNDQTEIEQRVKAEKIKKHITELAKEAGWSFDDTVIALRSSMPDISKYLSYEKL